MNGAKLLICTYLHKKALTSHLVTSMKPLLAMKTLRDIILSLFKDYPRPTGPPFSLIPPQVIPDCTFIFYLYVNELPKVFLFAEICVNLYPNIIPLSL